MNYYPHHLGDYAKDTSHLSMTEHGAYRLLMDHYYATEHPLPADLVALCRIARASSKAEKAAVQTVSASFFSLKNGFLEHKRVNVEILAYRRLKQRNIENGRFGGRPRKNPVGSQSVSSGFDLGNPNETEANSQEPIASNQTPDSSDPAKPVRASEVRRVKWNPDDGWSGITDSDRTQWLDAFPACDVEKQISRMDLWLRSNPAKAKKSNFYRFIVNWLQRQQNQGGDVASNKTTNGNDFSW